MTNTPHDAGVACVAVPPSASDPARHHLLAVPLPLWGLRALRWLYPLDRILIATRDPAVILLATRAGLKTCDSPPPHASLIFDASQPLCSRETLDRAARSADPRVTDAQTTAIERLRADSDQDLDLLRALARGLHPDHPAIIGAAAYRLPSWTWRNAPDAPMVQALISDVDGCLTDGGIAYADGPDAGRTFNTHDGLMHQLLRDASIKIGWLSATSSPASIERRAAQLRVHALDAGPGDKGPRFLTLCARLNIDPRRAIYLGDDLNDLPAMRLAGASACPADAVPAVRACADILLTAPGGRGAFRELGDIILATS